MPKKKPVEQSAEWKAVFQRDLTDDVYARVLGYAEKISLKLHIIEGITDPGYAKSLVLDAVGDTLRGIRQWYPARRSLHSHLCSVVQSRAYHDTQRAIRRPHIAYHEPDDIDEQTGEVSLAETEMSLRRDEDHSRPEGAVVRAELFRRFCRTLRTLAADDAELVSLIDAYTTGCDNRAEVMKRLSWTLSKFVNVRRRLNTLLGRLPEDLRAAAFETVTRAALPARLLAA
jgi:hypothetical protein